MQKSIDMAKDMGIALTADDFKKPVEELADDELDAVAGGADVSCACAMGGGGTKDGKTTRPAPACCAAPATARTGASAASAASPDTATIPDDHDSVEACLRPPRCLSAGASLESGPAS